MKFVWPHGSINAYSLPSSSSQSSKCGEMKMKLVRATWGRPWHQINASSNPDSIPINWPPSNSDQLTLFIRISFWAAQSFAIGWPQATKSIWCYRSPFSLCIPECEMRESTNWVPRIVWAEPQARWLKGPDSVHLPHQSLDLPHQSKVRCWEHLNQEYSTFFRVWNTHSGGIYEQSLWRKTTAVRY